MALTDTTRTMLSCNPPSSSAAALPVGLSYQPHTHVPSSDNNAADTCKSRCNMCSKQCLPSTCHHKQDIHRHRHTCNYVRPAYQPKNDCPKPSKHTLQIS